MKQNKIVIAFSGKRGVGKTLSAHYLAANYGFTHISFAACLKTLSKNLFPFSGDDLYGETKEEKFKEYEWTPRDFMIKFGQFMRYFDSNYWVERIDLKGERIVIDDLRYENEYHFLTEQGAKLIRIERYKSLNPYKEELNDESENALDSFKFDYVIKEQNNGTKTDLYASLHRIIKNLTL